MERSGSDERGGAGGRLTELGTPSSPGTGTETDPLSAAD